LTEDQIPESIALYPLLPPSQQPEVIQISEDGNQSFSNSYDEPLRKRFYIDSQKNIHSDGTLIIVPVSTISSWESQSTNLHLA
jgi:hypothetical protein